MTRDEEVRNAIDTIIPISPSRNGRTYEQALMASGFEAGVKWADAHPKSPWISVDEDLPCNHEELVHDSWHTEQVFVRIVAKNGVILYTTNAMINVQLDKKWKWTCGEEYKVTHWMSIPKLPKEYDIEF